MAGGGTTAWKMALSWFIQRREASHPYVLFQSLRSQFKSKPKKVNISRTLAHSNLHLFITWQIVSTCTTFSGFACVVYNFFNVSLRKSKQSILSLNDVKVIANTLFSCNSLGFDTQDNFLSSRVLLWKKQSSTSFSKYVCVWERKTVVLRVVYESYRRR